MAFTTDIKLDADWQVVPSVNSDFALVTGSNSFIQSIRLEAVSVEGDLFFDPEWGWSLIDFLQSQDDEITRLEMVQRVRTKLVRYDEIIPDSIDIAAQFDAENETITITATFKTFESDEVYSVSVDLSRINAEVVLL